jgi:hypothetical protein
MGMEIVGAALKVTELDCPPGIMVTPSRNAAAGSLDHSPEPHLSGVKLHSFAAAISQAA